MSELLPIEEESTTEAEVGSRDEVTCWKCPDKVCQCQNPQSGCYCGMWFPEATD